MRFERLKFDDDKIYRKPFVWEDWMWAYSSHNSQKEVMFRYDFCRERGIDRYHVGCDSFSMYNALKGRRLYACKHHSLYDELCRDFPHYECLDHVRVYKNSSNGKAWVLSLVYLDTREKIKESCDKWGYDVDFYSWDGVDYKWMYVAYKNKE